MKSRKVQVVMSDVYSVRQGGHAALKTRHVWEQPIDGYTHFIRKLTRPGSLTLDPFVGSGTSGASVLRLGEGRRWIGTEIEASTHRICRKRLKEEAEALQCAKVGGG